MASSEAISKQTLRIIDANLDRAGEGLRLLEDIARKLLPMDKILGGSARTIEQATTVQSEEADYIGVGSMYPTPSKETAVVVGPERLRQIRPAISLQLVAIGGITRDNTPEVIAAGADSVAVISAILGAESPDEASRQIADCFEPRK